MLDKNIKILTAKGAKYEISPSMYDLLCLTSDRKLYFNEAYASHLQILNKIAYFKLLNLFDGLPIPIPTIKMRELYDTITKRNVEFSHLQREVQDLFEKAAINDASDVHIIVRLNECLVKIRKIGDLELIYQFTSEHGNAMCKTIFMTMCDQSGKTFQSNVAQEARMKAIFLPDNITGVRIQTNKTDNGYIMVCRLLKKIDQNAMTLEKLGYDNFQIKLIDIAKSKQGGINIFAGPTGSGKSSSLASILSNIIEESNGKKHIVTIENPVEYAIGGQITIKDLENKKANKMMMYATQTPVMAHNIKIKKEKFGESMSAMMRLDPDVIMIGEIRDAGSLKAASDASMTGHQVWTTVHATTAIGIIKRLLTVSQDEQANMEKEYICDATVISSLIAQKLVKKLCPFCSLEIRFDDLQYKAVLLRLSEIFDNDLSNIKQRGTGCNRCNYSGLSGRTVIAEIINCDQKFMELIINSTFQAEEYWVKELSGITMMMHGLLKVKRSLIDPLDLEDELEYINIPKYQIEFFKKFIKKNIS